MLIDFQIQNMKVYGVQLPLDLSQENFFSNLLPRDMLKVSRSRQQEYIAGRYCAIQAAQSVGFDLVNVPSAPTREPIWPNGVVGSITHSKQMAISCIGTSEEFTSLGIDAEELMANSMSKEVEKVIATDTELNLIRASGFQLGVTILFSAKEALYKALFPIVRTFIDFKEVKLIDLDLDKGTFELELDSSNPKLINMLGKYRGSFKRLGETIVTVVTISKKNLEGSYVHS